MKDTTRRAVLAFVVVAFIVSLFLLNSTIKDAPASGPSTDETQDKSPALDAPESVGQTSNINTEAIYEPTKRVTSEPKKTPADKVYLKNNIHSSGFVFILPLELPPELTQDLREESWATQLRSWGFRIVNSGHHRHWETYRSSLSVLSDKLLSQAFPDGVPKHYLLFDGLLEGGEIPDYLRGDDWFLQFDGVSALNLTIARVTDTFGLFQPVSLTGAGYRWVTLSGRATLHDTNAAPFTHFRATLRRQRERQGWPSGYYDALRKHVWTSSTGSFSLRVLLPARGESQYFVLEAATDSDMDLMKSLAPDPVSKELSIPATASSFDLGSFAFRAGLLHLRQPTKLPKPWHFVNSWDTDEHHAIPTPGYWFGSLWGLKDGTSFELLHGVHEPLPSGMLLKSGHYSLKLEYAAISRIRPVTYSDHGEPAPGYPHPVARAAFSLEPGEIQELTPVIDMSSAERKRFVEVCVHEDGNNQRRAFIRELSAESDMELESRIERALRDISERSAESLLHRRGPMIPGYLDDEYMIWRKEDWAELPIRREFLRQELEQTRHAFIAWNVNKQPRVTRLGERDDDIVINLTQDWKRTRIVTFELPLPEFIRKEWYTGEDVITATLAAQDDRGRTWKQRVSLFPGRKTDPIFYITLPPGRYQAWLEQTDTLDLVALQLNQPVAFHHSGTLELSVMLKPIREPTVKAKYLGTDYYTVLTGVEQGYAVGKIIDTEGRTNDENSHFLPHAISDGTSTLPLSIGEWESQTVLTVEAMPRVKITLDPWWKTGPRCDAVVTFSDGSKINYEHYEGEVSLWGAPGSATIHVDGFDWPALTLRVTVPTEGLVEVLVPPLTSDALPYIFAEPPESRVPQWQIQRSSGAAFEPLQIQEWSGEARKHELAPGSYQVRALSNNIVVYQGSIELPKTPNGEDPTITVSLPLVRLEKEARFAVPFPDFAVGKSVSISLLGAPLDGLQTGYADEIQATLTRVTSDLLPSNVDLVARGVLHVDGQRYMMSPRVVRLMPGQTLLLEPTWQAMRPHAAPSLTEGFQYVIDIGGVRQEFSSWRDQLPVGSYQLLVLATESEKPQLVAATTINASKTAKKIELPSSFVVQLRSRDILIDD